MVVVVVVVVGEQMGLKGTDVKDFIREQ